MNAREEQEPRMPVWEIMAIMAVVTAVALAIDPELLMRVSVLTGSGSFVAILILKAATKGAAATGWGGSAVLVWLMSWVMLFIGAASLPESTSPPAPQRVAAQQEEVLPYEIVVVYETGIHGIRRPDYRIQLSAEYSEAQARAIAASIVESRHMRSDLVNAAGFRFHFPGLDPEGGISNGWIYWAPDGDWGKAFDITAGDYDTFRFETYYYR